MSGASPDTGRFGSRVKQRIAEYRITNIEGWKRCALSFYNGQNTFIRRSMFISFFSDQTIKVAASVDSGSPDPARRTTRNLTFLTACWQINLENGLK